MAHHKSAIKRIKTNEKARIRNRQYRSQLKTEIKKLHEITDPKEAEVQLRKTISTLDKLVVKGIIHRNKAGNKKSKYTNYVKNLSEKTSENETK